MAKDQFSFDIVSEVDMQEVRNAVDQTGRELSQRFDFKGTDTTITLGDEHDRAALGHRGPAEGGVAGAAGAGGEAKIPLKALQAGAIEDAAKGTARQTVTIVTGISDEKTKEISKFVRQAVPKIQTQIQGAQVRVLGKSKDDLQAAIRAVKDHDFGLALQFTNYRP